MLVIIEKKPSLVFNPEKMVPCSELFLFCQRLSTARRIVAGLFVVGNLEAMGMPLGLSGPRANSG
jgi:hypothetical protein